MLGQQNALYLKNKNKMNVRSCVVSFNKIQQEELAQQVNRTAKNLAFLKRRQHTQIGTHKKRQTDIKHIYRQITCRHKNRHRDRKHSLN